MGDRATQIRAEWFVKCASVVLQARVPSQPPTAAAGKDRKNRWVRPRVEREPMPFGHPRSPPKAKTNARARFVPRKNEKTRETARLRFFSRERPSRARLVAARASLD
jgi:hypothetical protein